MNTERGTLNAQQDGINNLGFAQDWTLSQTGNWDAFKEDENGNSTWDLEQTRTHNEANEISDINQTAGPTGGWAVPDHDMAGNMTTMPQPHDLTESFSATYDAWNRLIEIENDDTENTVAAYRYNGQHRRIVAKVYDASGGVDHTRYFHYSAQWQVIEERVDNGSGGNEGDVERQFVWGLEYVDELVVRFRDTTGNGTLDETLYVLCDTNYRITAIVDDNGAVQERYIYSPYGQRTVLNPNWTLHTDPAFGGFEFRYGHQGLRHDPETGLIYNRWRLLHVQIGRFVQPDPLGYVDGPNLYQYVRGNPLRYADALGLEAGGCCGPDVTGWFTRELHIHAAYFNVVRNWPWQSANNGLLPRLAIFKHYASRISYKWMNFQAPGDGCPSENCAGTVTFMGKCIHRSELGNMMFGSSGIALGIPPGALIAGGQWAGGQPHIGGFDKLEDIAAALAGMQIGYLYIDDPPGFGVDIVDQGATSVNDALFDLLESQFTGQTEQWIQQIRQDGPLEAMAGSDHAHCAPCEQALPIGQFQSGFGHLPNLYSDRGQLIGARDEWWEVYADLAGR